MELKNNQNGFTIFEIVIVMIIMAIIFPTLFGILYTITQQQFKIFSFTSAKREGEYVYSFIRETILRDAQSISDDVITLNPRCNSAGSTHSSTTGDNFVFINKATGDPFTFELSGTDLVYNNNGTISQIHSANVQVNSLLFLCRKNSETSPPIVQYEFEVQYTSQTEDTITLPYKTKVVIKP